MNTSLTQRAISLSFAAIVTVMTLAGVNALATPAAADALMAQTTSGQRA
jgi:hypothetical protein